MDPDADLGRRSCRVELTIEQEDIDDGIPWEPIDCPAARAMRKKFGADAEVQSDYAVCGETIYKLSPGLTAFISDFDNDRDVEPGTYQIWEVGT